MNRWPGWVTVIPVSLVPSRVKSHLFPVALDEGLRLQRDPGEPDAAGEVGDHAL